MHPEGFKPLRDSLKNWFTIFWLVLAVALAVDLLLGSHGIAWLVGLQLKMGGHNPSADSMRMMTVFGMFTSASQWVTFVQRFLLIVAAVFSLVPVLRGLWVSVSGK
jgi:hypothetical protein